VRLAIVCAVLLVTGDASAAYAHRWTWKSAPEPAALEKCVTEMKGLALRRAGDLEVVQTGPRELRFNGRSDLAQEEFVFPGAIGFNSVRTDGKPYDAVVTAGLIAARACFAPEILEIKSDGDWVDWREGRLLYEEVHGSMAANPGIEERHAPGGKVPPHLATARDQFRKPWAIVIALCMLGLILLMIVPTKKSSSSDE
jgi:hypothetical protein